MSSMKKIYILLIFAIVFGGYEVASFLISYQGLNINIWNFLFINKEYVLNVKQTNDDYSRLSREVSQKRNDIKRCEQQFTLLTEYTSAHSQIADSKRLEEIVHVERMSSAYIMNNPAFYKREIKNNNIKESGKGADNEDITVIRLSDGYIIKASPRSDAKWLGVRVGEKVKKITLKTYSFKWNTDPTSWENPKGGISVKDEVIYLPLYN